MTVELKVIGYVQSPLANPAAAPRQPDEGAPGAWLRFEPDVLSGLRGLRVGDEVLLLTWLHHARRDVLQVRPRDDASRAETGVFCTRSADRPNPIGLHAVTIAEIEGERIRVHALEAVDGTPILDVKPILESDIARR
jgi:tRNA-Thr(GGU) m(6)t(6)A37 methyltransferase TsaA